MCVLCLYSSLARFFLLYSHCVCVGANCPKLYPFAISVCTRCAHRLFGANSWIFKSSFTVCAFMFSPTLTPEESRAKPWSSHRVLSLTAMFNKLILLNTLYAFASTTCLLKYIYIYIFSENTLGECRINILKIERRKRRTTGEKKK